VSMAITNEALQAFLSDHLQAEITAVEPVGGGEWSQAFFFTTEGRRKVIRFSAYDEDFRKDAFAARFSSRALPIPPIEEIGEAFGLFFAISTGIDGKMIDALDAAEMRVALPAILDLFNALREVDASQTRGYGGFGADGNATLSSWRQFITSRTLDTPESRLRGWKAKLARHPDGHEIYQRGRQRLLELVPLCPEERHLVHNDLLHFNLILQGERVAALIDWGCGLWGDYLYDLAMFTTWQFYYPAMAGIDLVEEARRSFAARHVPLPHYYERVQCYQLHLLLDSLAYNAWKEDQTNLELTIWRLEEVLAHPISAA